MFIKGLTFDRIHHLRLILSLLLPFMSINVFSQALSQKEWNKIQKSGDYIIGMGMSESMDQARQVAMGDLVGKISTNVKTRFDIALSNTDGKKSESKMEKIIRSYSSVRLNNVSERIDKDHGYYVIFRYISKSDLSKMFKRRVTLAENWTAKAIDCEKEGKICDALQYFYWSWALLYSCPDDEVPMVMQDYKKVDWREDVCNRMKSILDKVTVKATAFEDEEDTKRLTLKIDYKEKPVANFNYKYFDEKSQSEVFSAKDGIGELIVPTKLKLKKLKIKAECEFRAEANIHPELQNVMEMLGDVSPVKDYYLEVDTRDCRNINSSDYALLIDGQEMPPMPSPGCNDNYKEDSDISSYASTIQKIVKGITQKNYADLENNFTSEGWDMFGKLIKYGNAKLLKSPDVQFVQDGKYLVCRSFPMSFAFQGNKRVFKEDVVFYLNNEGKVCEVAFGLEKRAVDDIMNRGTWSEEARKIMVHFLETYKTAYALKRLDYINSIFSQDALIITGSIVRSTRQKELSPAKMEHVKYTRQTKEQYMKNLDRCFKSNEFINLHFADNIVRRANKPDFYGIQIKQDYYSSTYGDTGYLFLLIDFTKPEAPLIHVRAWQPDENPNLKDENGRISMADFWF